MSPSTLQFVEEPRFVIAISPKYFAEETSRELNTAADSFLPKGKHTVIIDFSQCELINSPGVAGMLDLMLKIVEDYRGQLVFCGANQLLIEVFELANILEKVQVVDTLENARTLIAS